MKQQPSVSIGIPAYNEGANIKKLLHTLLAQNIGGFVLKEIIVASDGSTDDTVKQVRSVTDSRIQLLDAHNRLGKSARLDTILRTFKGDILILMDADIVIKDPHLLEKTVQQGNLIKSGIIGVNAKPLVAHTYVEKILEAGVMIMKKVASSWNNGNNYLSFKGCYLALNGKFAKKIFMPANLINNDAYLYFSAVKEGYKPSYLAHCEVFYRSPQTLKDHLKQSSRFATSSEELEQHFFLDLENAYLIPTAIMVKSIINVFATRPVTTILYLGVNLLSRFKRQKVHSSMWSIAESTKDKLHI